jgi:nucleoside-diphosphate-sugar epimerase
MKILLIGHEGYIGKGLLEFFLRQHQVIGWDKKEDLFSLSSSFLAKEGVQAVVNLSVAADRAAQKFQADAPTDLVNVMGARHLAKILKGSEIAWIQMSTREVLGPVYTLNDVIETQSGYRPRLLVKEDQPYNPQNFYGKSKIMAEFISESHPYSNVIRLTTCYTDYDHSGSNWVLSLVRTAVQNKPVKLTRGGQQFRDPLHVEDLGRLMELLCEKKVYGERIHAGGGAHNVISLREFVTMVNPKVQIEIADGGDYGFAFDITKAAQLTGWEPKMLIRERIPVLTDNIRQGKFGPTEK